MCRSIYVLDCVIVAGIAFFHGGWLDVMAHMTFAVYIMVFWFWFACIGALHVYSVLVLGITACMAWGIGDDRIQEVKNLHE